MFCLVQWFSLLVVHYNHPGCFKTYRCLILPVRDDFWWSLESPEHGKGEPVLVSPVSSFFTLEPWAFLPPLSTWRAPLGGLVSIVFLGCNLLLRSVSGLLLLFTQALLSSHVISSGKPSLPNKCITLLLLAVILLIYFMYIVPFMAIVKHIIYATFSILLASLTNSMLLYCQSLEQCLALKSLDIDFFLINKPNNLFLQ